MTPHPIEFVLPRPGGAPSLRASPIPGPSEEVFTQTFGTLLPPAKYLKTIHGKAAYYELLPLSRPDPGTSSPAIDRAILVHGVQTPALGMLPLANALRASFPATHFVLVDLWGHGLSDTPVVPFEQSLFLKLLDALLNELDWLSAHVVGYSFGGALTIGYTVSRPSRMKSFTLVAPAGLIQSSRLTPEQLDYLRGDDEIAARKWILAWLEGGELIVPADWKERVAKGEVVAQAVKEWQMRENPGHTASVVAVVRDAGAFDNDAMFAEALRTGIPNLAVLGELDDVCTNQQLEDVGFENVVVVPHAGHAVVREKVDEVATAICEFWSGLDVCSGS